MSFEEQLVTLKEIHRLQHDLSNQIIRLDFAEEQGYLSDTDRDELDQIRIQFQQRSSEETALREKIKTEYSDQYNQYLHDLLNKVTAVQKYLSTLQGELEFKHSFNKSLCKNLLSDLSKFIKNQKIQNDLNWLFDVSARLIEEYKDIVKA